MKYGFSLVMRGADATQEGFHALGEKAETLKLDALWCSDHIVVPPRVTSKYPGRASGEFPPHWYEGYWTPFTALSYLAGVTKTVTLGTSVLILPMRNPIEVARQAAEVDQLSHGRFMFGVGVGWFKEEFDALAWPFRQRGARTDEGLEICKVLWSQERPSYKGRFYEFDQVYFNPKPVQKPHPPIWIAGNSPVAIARAARVGSGWHPNRPTFSYLEEAVPELRKAEKAAGRKEGEVALCVKTMMTFQDGPAGEGQMPTEGRPQEIIDAIKRYQDLGATHFTFDYTPESIEQGLHTMERFAQDVRPKL